MPLIHCWQPRVTVNFVHGRGIAVSGARLAADADAGSPARAGAERKARSQPRGVLPCARNATRARRAVATAAGSRGLLRRSTWPHARGRGPAGPRLGHGRMGAAQAKKSTRVTASTASKASRSPAPRSTYAQPSRGQATLWATATCASLGTAPALPSSARMGSVQVRSKAPRAFVPQSFAYPPSHRHWVASDGGPLYVQTRSRYSFPAESNIFKYAKFPLPDDIVPDTSKDTPRGNPTSK